jgi:hypothetical protein
MRIAPFSSFFCGAPGSHELTNSTLVYSGPGSQQNTVSTTIPSLAAGYSLAQILTVSVGSGSSININTSQILSPVIPEPTSISLLGVGLLGFVALARKRLFQK